MPGALALIVMSSRKRKLERLLAVGTVRRYSCGRRNIALACRDHRGDRWSRRFPGDHRVCPTAAPRRHPREPGPARRRCRDDCQRGHGRPGRRLRPAQQHRPGPGPCDDHRRTKRHFLADPALHRATPAGGWYRLGRSGGDGDRPAPAERPQRRKPDHIPHRGARDPGSHRGVVLDADRALACPHRTRRLASSEEVLLVAGLAAPLFSLAALWVVGTNTTSSPTAPYLWLATGALSFWLCTYVAREGRRGEATTSGPSAGMRGCTSGALDADARVGPRRHRRALWDGTGGRGNGRGGTGRRLVGGPHRFVDLSQPARMACIFRQVPSFDACPVCLSNWRGARPRHLSCGARKLTSSTCTPRS